MIIVGAGTGEDSLVRILAIDKGSGISNIADAMSDGYSTAGTMGGGMGAMKRMATSWRYLPAKPEPSS